MALLDLTNGENFLDRYRFRTMPSLLTMGILKQLPQVVVNVPEDSQKFCVVGNPTIPQFMLQDEMWNLGKLPFATEEAEWVAHILKCTPTLHEQATKMLVLSMISNSKVVHLATHGSAAAGFLAFASVGSSRRGQPPDEKMVLIYPEDIERLSISPALVVLSSCDSGRGTVKADGILGMARAFILAGAQAVLTISTFTGVGINSQVSSKLQAQSLCKYFIILLCSLSIYFGTFSDLQGERSSLTLQALQQH